MAISSSAPRVEDSARVALAANLHWRYRRRTRKGIANISLKSEPAIAAGKAQHPRGYVKMAAIISEDGDVSHLRQMLHVSVAAAPRHAEASSAAAGGSRELCCAQFVLRFVLLCPARRRSSPRSASRTRTGARRAACRQGPPRQTVAPCAHKKPQRASSGVPRRKITPSARRYCLIRPPAAHESSELRTRDRWVAFPPVPGREIWTIRSCASHRPPKHLPRALRSGLLSQAPIALVSLHQFRATAGANWTWRLEPGGAQTMERSLAEFYDPRLVQKVGAARAALGEEAARTLTTTVRTHSVALCRRGPVAVVKNRRQARPPRTSVKHTRSYARLAPGEPACGSLADGGSARPPRARGGTKPRMCDCRPPAAQGATPIRKKTLQDEQAAGRRRRPRLAPAPTTPRVNAPGSLGSPVCRTPGVFPGTRRRSARFVSSFLAGYGVCAAHAAVVDLGREFVRPRFGTPAVPRAARRRQPARHPRAASAACGLWPFFPSQVRGGGPRARGAQAYAP
ncbi:hypothetical protein ACSSS7_005954 [Eimeria intestinalis]